MGYPVAYRRVAPVRNVRGSQPYGSARRNLGRDARSNAREPLLPFDQKSLADAAFDLSPFGGWQAEAIKALLNYIWPDYQNQGQIIPSKWVAPAGYTQCSVPFGHPCIDMYPTHWQGFGGFQTCSGFAPCSMNQPAPAVPLPVTGTPNRILFYNPALSNPGTYTLVGQFLKTGAPASAPYRRAPFEYSPEEFEVPSVVDPWGSPLGQPDYDWPPLPYKAIPERPDYNPWRSPVEQPIRGPRPLARPLPRPEIRPGISESDGNPGPTIVVGPNGDIDVFPPQPPANPKPPPRKTKERKAIIAVGGRVAKLVNITTEAKDFLDAMWKALPKDCRSKPEKGSKKVRAPAMMRDIYGCFGRIDLVKWLKGFLENELQDRFYGRAGQAYRKAVKELARSGYYNRGVGFQFGDRYRPHPNVKGADDPLGDFDKWLDRNLPSYSPRDAFDFYNP